MDQVDTHDTAPGEGVETYAPGPAFLAGLTKAMHETASRARGRMAETVAEDAKKHVELAQARAVIEAAELHRSAEEDIEAIEVWSADEIVRIREETDRRKKQRRADLEAYLERHASIIEAEVAGVDFAVAEYQATLDAFIDGLLVSNDAADIARRAGTVPPAPDLDRARATARATAVARYVTADEDGPGVGVMDPAAVERPDGVSLPVDPLQAPDEDLVVVPVGPAREGAASSPSRLIRVLGQWIAAPEPNRSDAAREG
jgi:hypothetical protein